MKMITRPGDVEQLTLLYKMTRELARRMPAYRGEVAAYHPKFPPGSPAACRETDDPVPINAPDIVYSNADDEAIAKFNRDVGESSSSDHSRFHFRVFSRTTIVVFTTWHAVSSPLDRSESVV